MQKLKLRAHSLIRRFGPWFAMIIGGFSPLLARADSIPNVLPTCRDAPLGCKVCDAFQVAQNVVNLSVGVAGSAALLLFAWGGLNLIMSRGFSEKVQRGKDTLINATKGIGVILGAWLFINFIVVTFLTGSTEGLTSTGKIFGSNWASICTGTAEQPSETTTVGGSEPVSSANCVAKHPTGGWACTELKNCQGFIASTTYNDCGGTLSSCEKNLCPGAISGANTVVCCVPKSTP